MKYNQIIYRYLIVLLSFIYFINAQEDMEIPPGTIANDLYGEVIIQGNADKNNFPGFWDDGWNYIGLLIAFYGGDALMEDGFVVLGYNFTYGLSIYLYAKYKIKQAINRWGSLRQIEARLVFRDNSGHQVNEFSVAETGLVEVTLINVGSKPVKNISPTIINKISKYRPGVALQDLIINNKSPKKAYKLMPGERLEMSSTLNISISAIEGKKEISVDLSGKRSGRATLNVINPLPPDLIFTDIQFLDQDGNQMLDGLESGELFLTIKNEGNGGAKSVQVKPSVSSSKIIFLQEMRYIGNLNPGDSRQITFDLVADRTIGKGKETIRIDGKEQRGFDARPIKVSIETQKLVPSEITVDQWSINDGDIGLANGNNNRIIENGEEVEITIEIKNIAAGPVYGSVLYLSTSGGILPNTNQKSIGQIAPFSSVDASFSLNVPVNYDKDVLSVGIKINDERNTVNYSRSILLESYYRKPELEFDYVVYDGSSPGSKGNENGMIEQGETVELEILPQNLGDYEAHDVTFKVEVDYNGIRPTGNKYSDFLDVGRIPAKKSGKPVLFPFVVQRSAKPGIAVFDVEMEQSNFEGLSRSINLEINEESIQTIAFGRQSNTSGFGNFMIDDNVLIPVDVAPLSGMKNNKAVAVVIGNRSYSANGVPSVEYAERDARIFKSYLTRTLGLKEGNINFIIDAQFSDFNEIFGSESSHKGQLYSSAKSGSDIFVFYSGHGAPDVEEGTGYFVPAHSNPSKIKLTGYPVERLLNNLAKIKKELNTGHISIFVDACFSGGTDQGDFLIKGISPASLKLKNINYINGISFFSASTKDQVSSWYRDARHGVFSYYLMAGIQGHADQDKDGSITNEELSIYLKNNVSDKVRELSGGAREQNPTFFGDKNRVLLQYNK